MPVMDGYKATYTIRHCEPFVADQQIQNTPIVAMTASAIQGDREKCENAGMNDYLAKPVKGKTLEQMLLKWAVEKKRKSSAAVTAGRQSKNDTRSLLPQAVPGPVNQQNEKPESNVGLSTTNQQQVTDVLATKLNKLIFQNDSMFARSAETAESSSMVRLRNEEKAMQLRDQALFESANIPIEPLRVSNETTTTHHPVSDVRPSKLTRENIEKLARTGPADLVSQQDVDTSSLDVTVNSHTQRQRTGRPSMGTRMKSDGEKTVLPE